MSTNFRKIDPNVSLQMMNDVSNSSGNAKEAHWMVYAETLPGISFTTSSVNSFTNYSHLISYHEDLTIVNAKLSGERGIHVANLVIRIPKDGNSVSFFNNFAQKKVLNQIKLVELITIKSGSSSKTTTKQTVTYETCRIENYINAMDYVDISINYNKRSHMYSNYQNGVNIGQIVSTTIS